MIYNIIMNINGLNIEFEVEKMVLDNVNMYLFKAIIIGPDDYKYKEGWERQQLVRHKADIRITYPYPINDERNAKKIEKYKNEDILNIDGFYVRKQIGEDSSKLKGLGYLLFCYAMNYMLSVRKPTVVLLDASGGVCNNSEKWAKENNIQDSDIENLYNKLSDIDKMMIPIENKDYLIRLMCVAESNSKLVKYYKKLGFKETNLNEDPLSVLMESDIDTLLKNCNI